MIQMQPGPFDFNDRAEACRDFTNAATIRMVEEIRPALMLGGFDACDVSVGVIRSTCQTAASAAFSHLTSDDQNMLDPEVVQAIHSASAEVEQLLYDRALALAAKLRSSKEAAS